MKEQCSTNRASYELPPLTTPTGHTYSRAAAISTILHSSVHLGQTDSSPSVDHTPFTTDSSELPPAGELSGEKVSRLHRNTSFMPPGDLDCQRVRARLSHSTTKTTLTAVSILIPASLHVLSLPLSLCSLLPTATQRMSTVQDCTLLLLSI